MKATTALQIAALACFLGVPAIALRVDPNAYEGGSRSDQDAIERRNESAIGTILGQLRTSMADIMYMKTELYLHNGVAFASHLNMQAMQSTGEITGASEAPTMIPDRDRDFRGIVGELERRVKPWQSADAPHSHTSGTELLPWYRLMTISDPHNIRAYQIGGWWLSGTKPEEALDFVEEGIANNPKAFQLRYLRGRIYMLLGRKAREGAIPDLAKETAFVRQALESFIEGADLALAQRPKDYDPDAPDDVRRWWTHYTEEDARATARTAVLLAREFKPPAEGLKMAKKYNEGFGGDGPLKRYVEQFENKLAEQVPAMLLAPESLPSPTAP